MIDSSLKRLKDAILGRSLYGSRPVIDYEQIVPELLKLQEGGHNGQINQLQMGPRR